MSDKLKYRVLFSLVQEAKAAKNFTVANAIFAWILDDCGILNNNLWEESESDIALIYEEPFQDNGIYQEVYYSMLGIKMGDHYARIPFPILNTTAGVAAYIGAKNTTLKDDSPEKKFEGTPRPIEEIIEELISIEHPQIVINISGDILNKETANAVKKEFTPYLS